MRLFIIKAGLDISAALVDEHATKNTPKGLKVVTWQDQCEASTQNNAQLHL